MAHKHNHDLSSLPHSTSHQFHCIIFNSQISSSRNSPFTSNKLIKTKSGIQELEEMMSINVSSASLVPQMINSKQNHLNNSNNLAPISLLLKANSQYSQPLKKRSFGSNNRTSNFSWIASVRENVESPVTPISVPVRVAHELLQAGHRYLDVRTPEEFSAGHVVGAINIPYMYRVGSGMAKNANFVNEVMEQFGKDDEIIVGCQLGKRSLMAATDLSSSGFSGITDIAGGYAAWLQTGLPTVS